ncbi:FecR domain-containing protein [Bradyrhizobium sp. 191]|uniref:FecR family protein n=1 Tax=Bradyrhizobium sp. 191 TaxID=2782659 RepID=UPI0020000377|nr:FecR domain-containing protein [Bradyrhizobium sp. 191]UPJ65524.1 FecR domain-containing protein [Bradyrhizobium sp. 191]
MFVRTITALATYFVLTLPGSFAGPAEAQVNAAPPAIQDAAKLIGKVVSVTGAVAIEHANAVVIEAKASGSTKVGDPVYVGDVIRTGADGRVGINFTDGTTFNLSTNARMVLDEFVYDPGGNSNSTLFSLTRGTFTFVAGKVAKTGDMKVDTPVATMGIRGTTPHVAISDDGSVKFSTLIEEGRKKTEAPATREPRQNATRKFDLNICRGC